MGPGDSGLKLNELYPNQYPAAAKVAGKTRDQVKAKLVEAIRTGNIVAAGESSLKENELHPQRYRSVTRTAASKHPLLSAAQ